MVGSPIHSFYAFVVIILLSYSTSVALKAKNGTLIAKQLTIVPSQRGLKPFSNPPVIGILSQPSKFQKFNESDHSYILRSYVSYFEQAGAVIVPLLYTQSINKLQSTLDTLDGLVIPGGGTNLAFRNEKTGRKEFSQFAQVGISLVRYAKQLNEQGRHFPVWGTCLGFEVLSLAFSQEDIRSVFDGYKHITNITLSERNIVYSKMFKYMKEDLKQAIRMGKIGFFFNHKMGFSPQNFLSGMDPSDAEWENSKQQQGAASDGQKEDVHKMEIELKSSKSDKKQIGTTPFLPLAYGIDKKGRRFVAIAEAKAFPFYGVQFHPEKLKFHEMQGDSQAQETFSHLEAVQFFANFFVAECKKRSSSSPSRAQRRRALKLRIELYSPIYLKKGSLGIYVFEKIKKVDKLDNGRCLSKENTLGHCQSGKVVQKILTDLIKIKNTNDKSKNKIPLNREKVSPSEESSQSCLTDQCKILRLEESQLKEKTGAKLQDAALKIALILSLSSLAFLLAICSSSSMKSGKDRDDQEKDKLE